MRKKPSGFYAWVDVTSDWGRMPSNKFEKNMAKRLATKAEAFFSTLGFGTAGDLHDDIDMFLVSRKRVYGDWPKAEREIIFRNIDLVRAEIADRGMKATGRG